MLRPGSAASVGTGSPRSPHGTRRRRSAAAAVSEMLGAGSSVYVMANPPPMSSSSTAMPWCSRSRAVSATRTSSSRRNGSVAGTCEPMCAWRPRNRRFGNDAADAIVSDAVGGRHAERGRLVPGRDRLVRVDPHTRVHAQQVRLHASRPNRRPRPASGAHPDRRRSPAPHAHGPPARARRRTCSGRGTRSGRRARPRACTPRPRRRSRPGGRALRRRPGGASRAP